MFCRHIDVHFCQNSIKLRHFKKTSKYYEFRFLRFLSPSVYNLITVRGNSTKLHAFVKHIKTTCHAQDP